MILQRLAELYDQMIDSTPDLPLIGYSSEKITHEIVIDREGHIVAIHDLQKDKKPIIMTVPVHEGRTVGIKPYVLCDTGKYTFGKSINKDGDIESYPNHLQAMIDLHSELLSKSKDDGLNAFVKFLELNKSGNQCNIPDDALKGTNLVFRLDGEPQYIHQSDAIKKHITFNTDDSKKDICLVSGEESEIARIHKGIKGVKNASSTGASLVGVNMRCAESDNKTQAYNSPVSSDIMTKYTTILNYLTSSRKHTQYIGDDTYVFWTKDEVGQDFIMHQLMGGIVDDLEATNDNIQQLFDGLANGISTDLKTDNVCLLVLSGNKGRIAVKGWYDGCLSDVILNAKQHQDDLSIVGLERLLTPYDLLRVSTRDGKVDKIPSVIHLGLRQAIMDKNKQYPRQLYVDVLDRLRKETEADSITTNIRYALIKAYLQRLDDRRGDKYMLDTTNTNIGYNLGRLFAAYEKIQYMANKKATIKDRFFAGASTTPLAVYPYLQRLSSTHVSTLKSRGLYSGEDIVLDITNNIKTIPQRLNLAEQGEFMLGYNHQKQYDKLQAIDKKNNKQDNTEGALA